MTVDTQNYKYNRSHEIELVLRPMDGKKSTKGTGLVDTQLFTGDNSLYAMMDTQTCLWYPKYKRGVLPPSLKQHFTSYNKLKGFVTDYFKKRNIEIVEEIDNAPTIQSIYK